MPTIQQEWISKNRLREVLWHERSLAETALQLAAQASDPAMHQVAQQIATKATRSAVALECCLPKSVVARVPDGATFLDRVGATLSTLGDRIALMLLASSVSAQLRRLEGVLEDIEGVDDEAHAVITGELIPEHRAAVAQVREARHALGRPAAAGQPIG